MSSLIPIFWQIGYKTRSHGVGMRFVKTPAAVQLTGLSTVTLREWTSRRALIPADLPPKGKGSPAGFTWHAGMLTKTPRSSTPRGDRHMQPPPLDPPISLHI